MRITCLVMVFGLSILTGCKQPDPNPELKDPIYLELKAKPDAFRAKVTDQEKKIAELRAELKEMPPRDPARKRTTKTIFDMERGLVLLKQEVEYYEVRAVQRLNFARKAYLEAFHADKDWPDPYEYQEYQKRKKMRDSSKSWESRVPKLTRHLPPDPEKKEKPKEAPKPAH